MTTLAAAIDRLYEVFANQPKPRVIEGCRHCLDDDEIRVLLSCPLRSVPSKELTSYASSVFLTLGCAADFLYFLPRILEVVALDCSWYPTAEIVGRAIANAEPLQWPASRLTALREFTECVVQAAIEATDIEQLDAWLCAIARMGLDVSPYLKQMEQSRDAVLGYFASNSKTLPEGRLVNAYWELPNTGHDAIVEWFYSDPIWAIPAEEWGVWLKRTT